MQRCRRQGKGQCQQRLCGRSATVREPADQQHCQATVTERRVQDRMEIHRALLSRQDGA